MAMAMRAAAAAAASASAAPRGLRGLFSTLSSTSLFNLPSPTNQTERPPPPEPSTNLFVSGLSKRTTTEGLREAFSKFGQVIHARVVTDRMSGYSKGFGFVRYVTVEEAAEGIKGMDGKFLDGWVIFAEYARPRPEAPPPPHNFNGPYGQQQ
ncbi:organelle RRM domain-containing protein 2, mitochondrial-like [Diospyros lotus]|uniref:organelle RRM domain-containing protein 2, mitochondrial-like n=1 Tax=Diospyros lotus TaxID=55363 RepID=UPI002251A710|nr:organelle RRM domain-containing protein 2, mitochondrial-like [Diospyros lotus]